MFLLYVEDSCEDGTKVADLRRRHKYAKPLLVEHHQNGLGNTQYMALCCRISEHAKKEVRLQSFVYTYVNSTSQWMHNRPNVAHSPSELRTLVVGDIVVWLRKVQRSNQSS